MKRTLAFLMAVLLVLGSVSTVDARGRYVVKGGITYASGTSVKDLSGLDIKDYTGWELGFGYQSMTLLGFSVQPELVYKVKGISLNDATNINMNYLEVPVNLQWGPNLVIMRPFIFASPFIGYNIQNVPSGSNNKITKEFLKDQVNKVEGGIGLGAGLDVWKLQITAKYNWNFGQVAKWDNIVNQYVADTKAAVNDTATGCFEMAIAFRF